jgi:hypothetical protein
MWWLAEGVDEGKVAVVQESGRVPAQKVSYLLSSLLAYYGRRGAESDIMNSLIIVRLLDYSLSIIKRHTSTYLTTSAASGWLSTIRKPCLSRNLNQVRVEGCFLVISSR